MGVKLLGINIDNYTFEEGINRGLELIHSNNVSQVITINPEMLVESSKNESFRKIVQEAEMVIPDGVGVKIGLKLKKYNVQRIPGIDFAKRLLNECAKENIPVAIVGAKEQVINKAIENLKSELNGLNIVYFHNGYFDNDNLIYEELKKVSPKLILVAMGSPRQEQFIYNAKSILNPALMVGIGGSLDVWSGMVKRAPQIYQKLGLEWLYRTILEPKRLKRIFPALPLFLMKVIFYKDED